MEAARKAEDAKLLATVKPAANVKPPVNKPIVNAPSVANTPAVVNKAVANNDDVANTPVANETYHRYKDKDARRAYMRAYMAKRRQA